MDASVINMFFPVADVQPVEPWHRKDEDRNMKILLLFITILAALVFVPAVIVGEYADAAMDIGQSQNGSNNPPIITEVISQGQSSNQGSYG